MNESQAFDNSRMDAVVKSAMLMISWERVDLAGEILKTMKIDRARLAGLRAARLAGLRAARLAELSSASAGKS